MVRTDIERKDVFISWTGKDRDIKDRIVGFLEKNGISCLESDYDCSGDFEQWSREAAAKCSVFLLVYTAHTADSKYVPIEVGVFKKQDDWKNRLIPVAVDRATYDADPFAVNAVQNAVLCENGELSDSDLALVLGKVQNLVIGRLHHTYFENTRPKHIRLVSLYAKMTADKQHDYTKLYIKRALTEVNENGETVGVVEDATELIDNRTVCCISGAAGSGKTLYLQQLREAAGADTVTIVLPCHKVADSEKDIFTLLYEEFTAKCGNRVFYRENHFKALLESRQVLLVFDGMDEISTVEGTRKMLGRVADYLETNGENTATVFTTRNEADARLLAIGGRTVRRFRLNMLCDEDVRKLGENLFLAFGIPEKNNEFYLRLQDLTDEIKTNPLLLSQLAIVYSENGDIPKTVVGIYDAIADITFSLEKHKDVLDIPADYTDMMGRMRGLLREFAYRRYNELSKGKNHPAQKLFSAVLKDKYTDDHKERAAFLTEYLQDRAILVEDEFYHKMFLEYFTAVSYYEQIFDDFDELENTEKLRELFLRYNDPYWSAVLKLFLLKVDSCVDASVAEEVYTVLLEGSFTDYTLLLEVYRDLMVHKEAFGQKIAADILKKSLDGTFPPYGPLFWYVPTYRLYAPLAKAVETLKNTDTFIHALALLRDVCWTCGHMHTLSDVTDGVSATALFAAAKPYLFGVRGALIELFLTGATLFDGGADVYPRCFNVAEAKAFLETECGVLGEMTAPFEDELGLYTHTATPVVNDEYIGWVSLPYDVETVEETLAKRSCRKVSGLLFTPTENTTFGDLSVNKQQVSVLYIPENLTRYHSWWDKYPLLTRRIYVQSGQKMYFDHCLRLPHGVKQVGWAKFSPELREVYLPDTVTHIDGWAFMECTALQRVVLPSGLQKIGADAFFGCRALEHVQLPDGLQEIGGDAFAGCTALRDIQLPPTLMELGNSAFRECKALGEIILPGSVQAPGADLFKHCTRLRRVEIREGVPYIANSMFAHCAALEEVLLPSSLTFVDRFAFCGCTALKRVVIPQRVGTIGYGAFETCKSLEEVVLPPEMEEIEGAAFQDCLRLKEIIFPRGVAAVADHTFQRCRSLTTVTLPTGVEEIGTFAFSECRSLSNIVLPDTLTEIGDWAFWMCTSLTEIHIPDGVDVIYLNTFDFCFKLRHITNLPANCDCVRHWRLHLEAVVEHRTVPIMEEYTVPAGVAVIEPHAFENWKTLTSIHLPQGLLEIGENAFAGCKNLEKIEIPDSVTTIEDSAFFGCKKLWSVHLPASLQRIANKMFVGCASLHGLKLPRGICSIGFAAFEGCDLWSIHIPDGVTEIQDLTFAQCSNLSEVRLPSTLQRIGRKSFEGCALKWVEIPDSVTFIDEKAFLVCVSLEHVTLPRGIDRIPNKMFAGCLKLAEIQIPEGVTVIETESFSGCTQLETADLPDGLIEIGYRAFAFCHALTDIRIPNTVRKIGSEAFAYCYSLQELCVPEGVERIPLHFAEDCINMRRVHLPQSTNIIFESAFERCKSLETITIPDGVTYIGDKAFFECEELQTLTIPSSVRTLGNEAFTGCTGLKSVTLSRRFEGNIADIFGDLDRSIFHFV